jgi:ribose 5-phosphate isomerase B
METHQRSWVTDRVVTSPFARPRGLRGRLAGLFMVWTDRQREVATSSASAPASACSSTAFVSRSLRRGRTARADNGHRVPGSARHNGGMKIAFGADDDNECTRAVIEHLRGAGELRVFESDKWPEFARDVGRTVADGAADYGVVMCWTGTGTSIAANKVPGVRAALAWEPWIAANARRWNDANVLALSLKRLAPDVAVECVSAFLDVTAEDPDESPNIDLIRNL